ncbi:hypothetical protein RchiOBHm_Chr5g0052941 [Rosa chinensis]|uniref:Uncharacterized protein n=1 Tax=Rosa chinensis TaxID=74649 RepID=A0A2P6QFS6_ROSCH|nr:hypothetical protein RchiOBHm_Chr5g0052941 [Rosa chinensis]
MCRGCLEFLIVFVHFKEVCNTSCTLRTNYFICIMSYMILYVMNDSFYCALVFQSSYCLHW